MSYIKLENVSKEIKGIPVLKQINLSIKKGTIIGLVGVNGSGKTMLLRAIAGLIHVNGKIEIDGKNMEDGQFPADMGVLIELPAFLSEFTGKKNLQLLGLLQDDVSESDIDEALISVGLNPEDKRPYRKYSLGMRERLGIAQAILKKPKIILLDEPTNGIDVEGIEELKKLFIQLKNNGSTLIIASHDRQFLEDLESINYEMKDGEMQ